MDTSNLILMSFSRVLKGLKFNDNKSHGWGETKNRVPEDTLRKYTVNCND